MIDARYRIYSNSRSSTIRMPSTNDCPWFRQSARMNRHWFRSQRWLDVRARCGRTPPDGFCNEAGSNTWGPPSRQIQPTP